MSKTKTNHKKQMTRKNKKQAVLGINQNKKRPVLWLLIAICIIGVGALLTTGGLKKTNPVSDTATGSPPPSTATSVVSYPLHMFDNGKAQHFDFHASWPVYLLRTFSFCV